jgi:Zinc dependent phospholipase C
MCKARYCLFFCWLLLPTAGNGWGFFAHKLITEQAIYILPAQMLPFYKDNKAQLIKACLNPDKRRNRKGEKPRHYFDVDAYTQLQDLPLFYDSAVARCGTDSLMKHGMAPWHLNRLKYALTQAFINREPAKILLASSEIAHYLADIHVPLHTTKNYNGQFSNQIGIHALWETQIPEQLQATYSYWTGPAQYIDSCSHFFRNVAINSHSKVDSVLLQERRLRAKFPSDALYCYVPRGKLLVKTFAEGYVNAYNASLNNMVERQLKASIKSVASIWFTCWVDGGQPDLKPFLNLTFTKAQLDFMDAETKDWQLHKNEWYNQPDTCSGH